MMNHHGPPIIGCSAPAEKLRSDVEEIACTNMTVMIRGEKGSGKDVLVREIHRKSKRAAGPFVRVNCAALPDELVEGELFGCMKGAFTGAQDRPGKFELADKGDIFLDEVGEMSMRAQPKLLHVTETRIVDRIGGREPIRVDFRLIVATNRNLEEMVQQGKFRDDLYDRLNMVSIWAPSLRERLDDIPLLVDYFIQECIGEAQRLVTGVSKEVLDRFQEYSWPGNIRELRNIVRRAVFTGKSEWIGPKDLPPNFGQRTAALPIEPRNHDEQVLECSRRLIVAALKVCRGNRTAAMKMLGLERKKFYRLLKLHGLDRESADHGSEESDWIL